jgi:hypothetical protein
MHRLRGEQRALKRGYGGELAQITEDADREIDAMRAKRAQERKRQLKEPAGAGGESLLAQIEAQMTRLAQFEDEAFRGLHVVLIKMRNDLVLEAHTIQVLKRRMGLAWTGDEGGGTYDLFEPWTSVKRISRELNRDWKKIDE